MPYKNQQRHWAPPVIFAGWFATGATSPPPLKKKEEEEEEEEEQEEEEASTEVHTLPAAFLL